MPHAGWGVYRVFVEGFVRGDGGAGGRGVRIISNRVRYIGPLQKKGK